MLRSVRLALGIVACLATAAVPAARAQSLTSGSLQGEVRSADGRPLNQVRVQLEGEGGSILQRFVTGRDGRFGLSVLVPGTYRVLAEREGYQPVRYTEVRVFPGRATAVRFKLSRKAPPIDRVVEIPSPPFAGGSAALGTGRAVVGQEIQSFDRRRDVGDVSRNLTEVEGPRDGRDGFAVAGGGLPVRRSRMFVDGIEELMLRHGGLNGEPAITPLFQRDGVGQLAVASNALDNEWRGTGGVLLSAYSRRGGDRLKFEPFLTYSGASLGGRTEDNPASLSGNSLQGGFFLGGPIIKDTASFALRADYQQLELPTSYPWEQDTASLGGTLVSLRERLPQVAQARYGANVGAYTQSVVRSWKGYTAAGRLDWQIGRGTWIMARGSFADWQEKNPLLGQDLPSNAGTTLDGTDVSGAISVTSAFRKTGNELRIGAKTVKRTFGAPDTPAASYLVNEGVGLGVAPYLRSEFSERIFDVTDAFQWRLGSHSLKLSGMASFTRWSQDYIFGQDGVVRFGSFDDFAAGRAMFYQVTRRGAAASWDPVDLGGALQDTWSPLAGLDIVLGVRYDIRMVPDGRIPLNQQWLAVSGLRNDTRPKDYSAGWQPRVGFVWDVQGRGDWVIRGAGGLHFMGIEGPAFAEAIQYSGGVRVRRFEGTLPRWPAPPVTGGDSLVRLTMFGSGYKAPRMSKADVSVSRRLGGQLSFTVGGGYHHSDYLLRRNDLNRQVAGLARTTEGRPVQGQLTQYAGMLFASGTTNRRFSGFDLVSGLVPTGYSDYAEVTAALTRQVATGFWFEGSYTYSRTRDNVLWGLSGDPADQLSPFPDRLDGEEWEDGISDFDIPHRAMLAAEYRSAGKGRLVLGGRFRFRSGRPFTAGFRPGVDANGDGGFNNDPAYLDANIPGMAELLAAHPCLNVNVGAFAERNRCREDDLASLDLKASIGLPLGGAAGSAVAFTVDVFNVVGTATGIVDRAAVLVDPSRSIVKDSQGRLVLPLVANSRFGTLLSRRTEPRMVRFGLRVEH